MLRYAVLADGTANQQPGLKKGLYYLEVEGIISLKNERLNAHKF